MSKTDARERIDVIERPVTDTADATAETQGAASTEDAVVAEETTTVTDDAEVSPGGSSKNADQDTPVAEVQDLKRRTSWSKVMAFGVLPGLTMVLAMTAGFLKWHESSARDDNLARIESVTTAREATVAMLSYQPDTVEKQLGAARDQLTGPFRDSYASLTNDVVIPGAKQKQISAVASVPAVASVAANSNHAVALVFVDQTVTVGGGAPTDTASTVRVTMDKVGNRWLISGFDPV
jgi:Mce-associated membrane protein